MKDVLRRFPKENYEVFKYVISHLNKWVNGGGQMTSGDCADYTTGQTVKWPKGDISVMSLLMFYSVWEMIVINAVVTLSLFWNGG